MGCVRGLGSGDLPKTASLESNTWKPRLLNLVEPLGFMSYKIDDTAVRRLEITLRFFNPGDSRR